VGAVDSIEKPVILFDGVCNLCNASIQFIIKRDPGARFQFASLQSDYAKSNLPPSLVDDSNLSSIVLLEGDQILLKSSAALSIARRLSGLWPILYCVIVIPKFIRDHIYDVIARNRYRWFGKRDECMIPSSDLKVRFLD